jgi:hypothetical protein
MAHQPHSSAGLTITIPPKKMTATAHELEKTKIFPSSSIESTATTQS